MNDQQRLLTDLAGSLFPKLGHRAEMAAGWAEIEQVGLPSLMVPEEAGGFGGTWQDALTVFRLAGYHGLALPLAEAAIAAGLAAGRMAGIGTIAGAAQGVISAGRFTGRLSGMPWGREAAFVVAPAPGGGAMLMALARSSIEAAENIAGEPRDTCAVEGADIFPVDADIVQLGAFARTAQAAGALDAALALCVGYVNERQQFGRPLAKFQAVQQALATLACEAAAVNCAAMGAAQALDRGEASYEIAAAKIRAGLAIGAGTAIAHQVHGAIGFTREYGLHPLTRRLWAWRSEFGGDAHWSALLGGRIAAAGSDRFWPDLTALSD